MKKNFKYVAFYDLDHTLLVDNSATHLVEEARRRGIMSMKQYRHAVYLSIMYKLGMGDPAGMINRMLSWLNGLKTELIRDLCVEVFEKYLVQSIRPEILKTLDVHRAQNGAVVLLSSATLPVCTPVIDHLQLDDLICTHLEEREGILTGRTHGNLVYGVEKRNRMLSYCRDNDFDESAAYYYGDSHTDQYVMEAVGKPVAVSPDKKLLKIANRLNWPILVYKR